MEIVFVTTHFIMAICITGVLWLVVTSNNNRELFYSAQPNELFIKTIQQTIAKPKSAGYSINARLAARNVAFVVAMSLIYVIARHYKPLDDHEKEIIAKVKGTYKSNNN